MKRSLEAQVNPHYGVDVTEKPEAIDLAQEFCNLFLRSEDADESSELNFEY